MAGAFKLPSLLKSKTKADYGLPRFVWNQVKIERELASGAYGQVYIGKYLSTEERVVIKKLKSESGDAKKRFIKEAKMLNDLKGHDNISQFQAFCDNPFAIVMEYSVFDFNPFGPNKAVTTLEDFVHFVDDEYDFSSFHEIVPVCAKDIASGLDFLHKRNIAHRDLKPSNVLVSNLHYTSKQDQELEQTFAQCPIVCKLADFGLSRSLQFQTHSLLKSRTDSIFRGTPMYMAPELYLESLKNASQAELQQCDIWSLGMVMYSILNPNVMSPYSKELENTGLSFDKDLLMNHCIPLHDEKYESIRVSEWWQVEECFKLCSNFLPNQRPTAAQVLDILTSQPENQLILKHLAVSQNTALERSDGKFAVLNEMTSFAETLQAPVNDGTNCCAFLGLGICDQILHDIAEAREVNWRRIIDISEHMINNLPLQLHGSRDLTSTYDVSEAYNILKSINLLTFSYELSEEFVKGKKVFSYGGREELMKSLGQKAASEKTCVGLYTCSPYTFVLGIHAESFFLVDTHCIGSEVGGNGNGILITTKDCSPSSCNVLTQWIIKRLKCSGIDGKEDQSLVWLTVEQENQAETFLDIGSQEQHPNNSSTDVLSNSESSITSDVVVLEEIEFYNGNINLPIYTKDRQVLKPNEVMSLLIKEKDFLDSKVCTTQPLQVQHHCTFIVDMRSLSNVKDIKCDDMGVWINNSCHKFYYTVTNEEDITIHPTKEKNGENVVTLKREYFALKYDTNNDVRKRIDIIQLPDKEIYRYGLVQYSFKDGEEHPVQHYKHGNSKRNDREYVRTWESTKVFLETASQNKRPREALHHVISEDLGGILSCGGIGQLPRNRQQSSDLKRKKAVKEMPISQRKNMSGRGKVDDPWYLLLGASKKQNDNKETSFIRDVRVGGEPLCVLASKRQLNDLRRFCCTETEFKPLTVDPTFNIGQFNVTPISYQHLLLETREKKHPTLIGPVLIHERKTEETYSTFASSLKTLEPGLSTLMAFGTDDEKALANGFSRHFERATHLLCEIHLKKNLERKLIELGITGDVKNDVISDVFGKQNGDVFESGLTEATSNEEFQNLLGVLKQRWSNAHPSGSTFYDWFVKLKAQEFQESVISPVRQRCGLGCPPERFTTNRSERTNGVIQEFVRQECGEKKVDEYVFATTLQKLVDIQEKEIALAILGQGEYELRDKFKNILVTASDWSKMTDKQKETAIQKIHTTGVGGGFDTVTSAVSRALQDDSHPLMETFSRAGVDWIPRDVLVHVISKACSLEDKVSVLPEGTYQTGIVPSSSNPKKPHVVVFHANGKCECQDCPGYTSVFVCAHAVAASVKLNRLDAFLKWLVATKRKTGGINYSKSIAHGMPAGRGKKPNQAPRKRSKAKHPSRDNVVVRPRITSNTDQRNPVDQRASSYIPPSPPCASVLPTSVQLPQAFPNQLAPQQSALRFQLAASSSTHPAYQTPMVNQCFLSSTTTASQYNYPSPEQDMFIIYLLNMCPQQTSVCFGCRNTLKPGGFIGRPPSDLVIISKMVRTWTHEGRLQSRPANVYFHCVPTCVRQKQPFFQPCHSFIAKQITPLLKEEHWQYLNQTFGNLAIQ